MRPRPSFRSRLLPALLAAGLAASLAPSPAFANSYKRGDYTCTDFQKYEKIYRADPHRRRCGGLCPLSHSPRKGRCPGP